MDLKKYTQLYVAFALLFAAHATAAQTTIEIDDQTTHQTIDGWEVTARMWQFDKSRNRFNNEWEADSEQLLDRLVNELGINRIRLEAMSGLENPVDYWSQFTNGEITYKTFKQHFYEKINDNDDPLNTDPEGFQFSQMDYQVETMVLPVKRLVEKNGEQLHVNLTYVDFAWTKRRGNLKHANRPDEYAELILACFNHLKQKYDLVPDSLELILEADNTKGWNGRHIGLGMMAAKAALNEAGFFPTFIAPSTARTHRANDFFEPLAGVPGALDALDTFSYHRYDEPTSRESVESIAAVAAQYNLKTAMLEHVGADYRELLQDLTVGNVSAWQQYGIASTQTEDRGAYYYKVENPGVGKARVFLESRASVLSLLFPHVRQDAVRVFASADTALVTPVVFINKNNTHVLALGAESKQSVLIKGLSGGQYYLSHATPDGNITRHPAMQISNGTDVPVTVEPGLTTLVQADAGLPVWINTYDEQATLDSPLSVRNNGGTLSIPIVALLLIYSGCIRRVRCGADRQGVAKAPAKSMLD